MPFLSAESLSLVDSFMLAVIVVGLPLETLLNLRKTRSDLASGAPGVRVKHYTSTIMLLWGLGLPILVLWAVSGRDWGALGFQIETGLMPLSGWLLAALVMAYFIYQFLLVSASEKVREQIRESLSTDAVMSGFMPQTPEERHLYNLLSMTAGINEEIIFRGFLIWAFGLYLPLWAAALASLVVFTALHLYQGFKNLPGVFLIGAAVTLIFVLSGSIWPAIAVHIFVDILNGRTITKARALPA
ncbi:MAG: CPBP family intramembrane metalloprotease [Hyphomonadaceae bacterium]|nr:CPBP family intramembrane metalloprotease [Hyphomonadaceae bacterium]